MTTTSPLEPQRPLGPDEVEIEARHLSITERWDVGSTHNIHLMENGDLGVILARGQRKGGHIPYGDVDATVIITLGVDDDHDEVHFTGLNRLDAEEILGQAAEALITCRQALARVRKS